MVQTQRNLDLPYAGGRRSELKYRLAGGCINRMLNFSQAKGSDGTILRNSDIAVKQLSLIVPASGVSGA